jgi:hypothetical protein
MATLIGFYHSGTIKMNKIGSYEFIGTKKEIFLLAEFLTLDNLIGLVREWLGWIDENFDAQLEGRIDVGSSNSPRMKMMSSVCNENEWAAYVGVVMKSEIRAIELVATRIGCNVMCDESSHSPTMPKAVDE